jgi:hypothetical protein
MIGTSLFASEGAGQLPRILSSRSPDDDLFRDDRTDKEFFSIILVRVEHVISTFQQIVE